MKKILLLSALAMIATLNVLAQTYQEKTDTIWGRNSMQETDGLPTTRSWDLKSFENVVQKIPLYNSNMEGGDTHLVYYIRMPEGHNRADLTLTTKARCQADFDFTLIDPITGDTLQHHHVVAAEEGKEQTVELMPDINIEKDGWYRFDLYLYDFKSYVQTVNYIVFQRESRNIVTTPRIYSSLATYLNGWKSTDPLAPTGEAYDMCYVEVYVPEKSDILSTYYSTMNVIGGYMGIQTAIYQDPKTGAADFRGEYQHNLIFSMWDNGNTDTDPNLPDYLKSGALDNDPDVKVNRFGGEGTGVNTMKTLGYGGKWWKPGHWVQMLCTARPEEVDVTLEDGSTIKYRNTLVTAWYKMADDPEWGYLATLRRSGISNHFDGWGSFLENWNSWGGQFTREMYMRNGYMRSLASHTWYHRNRITTGKYYDPKRLYPSQRDRRLDFEFGVSEDPETEGAFYMKAGGYFTVSDGIDRTLTVPLNNDGTAVDTINTENLLKRVDEAIIKDKSKEIQSKISKANTSSKRKALAESIMAMADKFNGYASEDLDEVREAYGNGENIDHSKLRLAMVNLSKNCVPLKYGVVEKKVHISSFRTYQLCNTKGGGVVTGTEVDGVKTLRATSATVSGATSEAAEELSVKDPNANWMILHRESDSNYYLYNIGQKKYLDLSQPSLLNDDPVPVTINQASGGYTIKQDSRTLISAPTSSSATVTTGAPTTENSIFELRDNYVMAPTTEEVKQQFDFIDAMKDLQTTLTTIQQRLSLPAGVVGSFKNDDERQQISELYNGGKASSAEAGKLISLFNSAEQVDFTPDQTLFRLRSAHNLYAARKPYITVGDDMKFSLNPDNGLCNQLFTIEKDSATSSASKALKAPAKVDGGYRLSSQGLGIKEIGETASVTLQAVAAEESTDIFFTERSPYLFSIGSFENSNISIFATSGKLNTGSAANATGQWYLEPVSEFSIATNAAGFAPNGFYADFDIELPEGLEAYVVSSVTADGTAKTTRMETQRIPARTAVILKGAKNTTYTLTILPATTPERTEPIENLLQGTLMKADGLTPNDYLLLASEGEKAVFKQSSRTAIDSYNTIYLPRTATVPDMETIAIETTTTGIRTIDNSPSAISNDAAVYDLQGRRVEKTAKGIVISGGKKTVVR